MRALLSVFFICCFLVANAQKLELTYTHLTTRDGLAGDNVYCAFQDSDGYIWFGTETGVSRYNGREFQNFYTSDGLADNEIYKIVQDSKGRIWFSALNGKLSYFKDGRFYNQENDPFLSEISLNKYFVRLFEDSKGRIWLTSADYQVGVLEQSGAYTDLSITETPVGWVFLFKEIENEVWGLHNILGLLKFTKESEVLDRPIAQALDQHKELEMFTEFMQGRSTFLTLNRQLPKLYIGQYTDFSGLKVKDITKLNYYGDEHWVSSNVGAFVFKKEQGIKTRYFEGKQITDVLKDREGNYWFTNQVNGVYYVPSFQLKSFSNRNSALLNGVTSLAFDGSEIIFGGNNGVFGSISGDSVSVTQANGIVGRSMVKNIEKGYREGQFFLASESRLIEVVKGRVSRTIPLITKVIRKVGADLYALGTNRGLILLTNQQLDEVMNLKFDELVKFRAKDSGSGHSKVALYDGFWTTDVERLGDDLIIGTLDGLYRLDKGHELSVYEPTRLKGKRVNDIHVFGKAEDLAIATHGHGILINRSGRWLSLSKSNGLRSDIVKKVWSTHPDTLWLSTNKGVNRLVLTEPVQISSITITDGLISEDVHDLTIHKNELTAATSEGISLINITSWSGENVAPKMVMSNMLVDGEAWQEATEVPYGHAEITLTYDGIHFRSLNRLTYEYRLLGLDDQWRKTSNNQMSFADLGPGNYTFEVRASSAFGDKSPVVAHSFQVTSPFWFNPWFWLIVLVAFLGLVFYLTQWVINKNKRKAQEQLAFQLRIAAAERKALQSQLNPHFIFNSLNSIQRMVLRKSPREAYNYLEKFSKLIRRVLDLSDTSMISLQEELKTIRLYAMLENLRLDNGFDFEVHIANGVNVNRLIPNLILQPFIENAIWHGIMPLEKARRGAINVTISEEDSTLVLLIEDNGVGRAFHQKTDGKGTQLTNDLIRGYEGPRSGAVEIIDLVKDGKAMGTRVRIKLKNEKFAYD